jgi:integrase/recombinase XerC
MGIPLGWEGAIGEHVLHMLAMGIRQTTVDLRRYQLGRIARDLGEPSPWLVTPAALALWAASVTHWAANTRRSYRTTVRGFYRWGMDAGYLTASPALGLPTVRPSTPNPRPAPDRVYRPALEAATPREALMLRLMADHGLRRGEVAVIHSRDLFEDLTGCSLVVHGKGGKERMVPLLDDVAAQLRRMPPGYAFPGRDAGHLSPRWVGRLVSRLLADEWTGHKLRHRAATRWWEASEHDLLTVGELLGHADPRTTKIYVRVSDARLRAVVRGAA